MTKEELIAEIEARLPILSADLFRSAYQSNFAPEEYRQKGDFAIAYVQLCTLLAELKGWLNPEPEQIVRFRRRE